MRQLSNWDLVNGELQNARAHIIAGFPTSGISSSKKGWMGYDSVTDLWGYQNATKWINVYEALSTNTANKVVLRDGSGNFSAGTITASLTGAVTGNASTATALATGRNISITGHGITGVTGSAFDGTAAATITISAIALAVGDITLATNSIIVGAAGVGSAVAKSAVPISDWGAATADIALGGHKITGGVSITSGDAGTTLVTKDYVDSIAAGLILKGEVRVASTANVVGTYSSVDQTVTVTATGVFTMDGVTIALNDVVLLKNQTTATQNGLYVCITAGAVGVQAVFIRASNFNTSALVTPGSYVVVSEGTTNADSQWAMTADAPVTLDTTNLPWTQFSGPGAVSAGNGMVRVGSTLHFASSSSYGTNAIFYASSGTAVGQLTPGANQVLVSNGSSVPSWGSVDLSSAQASGVLAAARFPALTGDVTTSSGAVATTIAANAVTLAKFQQIATASVLGRNTAGTGNVEVLTTLPSAIQGNITTLGTIGTGTWQGTVVSPVYGGTGIANNVASTLTITGSFATTITISGATSVTLPTSGTLSTLAGAETFTNKVSYNGLVITANTGTITTGTWSATTIAVAKGGTGQTSALVANGIIYASSTTAMACTALGTQYNVLVAGSAGLPGWGTINLASSAAVGSSILPSANGGTGSAYFAISGPTALRTYTLPDANATLSQVKRFGTAATSAGVQQTIAHGYGRQDISVQVQVAATGEIVGCDLIINSTNILATFIVATSLNEYTFICNG